MRQSIRLMLSIRCLEHKLTWHVIVSAPQLNGCTTSRTIWCHVQHPCLTMSWWWWSMSISQQNMICIDPTWLITTSSELQHKNNYDLTAMLQSDLLKLSFTGQNVHVHHCSLNEPCTNKCHLECISQCPALLSVLARTTIHVLHYWTWLDDQPGFTKSPHTCHKQRAFEIVTAWLVHYNDKCWKNNANKYLHYCASSLKHKNLTSETSPFQ